MRGKAIDSLSSTQRHALIERPGLVSRLEQSPAALTVIAAPAGYGKTTLLAQWAGEDTRPFTLVALERHHNDQVALLAAVCNGLAEVAPLGDAVFAPLASPGARVGDVVMTRLGEALTLSGGAVVLALDDLHLLTEPAAWETIEMLVTALPPGSTLALASRSLPQVHLSRLRASTLLIELDATDLSMTEAEAAALFEACGLPLEAEEVSRLVERTEGWPAGLYMACMALLSADDVATAVERFAGDDRLVADYLRDVILSAHSASDREFLASTSILETLSGPVCDAVVEGEHSGEILRRLAGSNLMMVPLDRSDETFRNHALLREMLQGDVRRKGERSEHELHLRAAGWYREHGELEDAIRHTIAAGDIDAAGALIWEQAGTYASHGGHATLLHWLSEFRADQVVSSPFLCLTMAASALTMGDGGGVEHWTAVALQGARGQGPEEQERIGVAAKVLRVAGVSPRDMGQMGADAAEAYSLVPEDSPWQSLCSYIHGVSLHLRGDRSGAEDQLVKGARRAGITAPTVEILCLGQLALLALDHGQDDTAALQSERATDMIRHYAAEDYTTNATVYAVSALTRVKAGDTIGSMHSVESCSRLLDGLDGLSPWFETETRVVLARALILLDDPDKARAQLAIAGKRMDLTPGADVLREWIEAAWAELEVAAATGGRWPLTAAELRLVHFLPTHLSFKEIADELFVSPNTVKTQAKSIYRKFGVRSRAEAVDCARSAGLLGAKGD